MATKLMQWLFGAGLFLGFWAILLSNINSVPVIASHKTIVLYLPIILIFIFGVYAVTVVLWRVYTFNDCEDAAKELMEEIQKAKTELKSKGFKFSEEEDST